jgi:SET domain-containing protein
MSYVFQAPEHGCVLVVLGYGMLYNHSARPNLEWDWSERTIVTFTSKRAIKPGEELTHDCTRDWWAARNRHPR